MHPSHLRIVPIRLLPALHRITFHSPLSVSIQGTLNLHTIFVSSYLASTSLTTCFFKEISADGSFITVITDIAIEPRPGIQLLELNDKIVGIALTLLRSDEFLKLYDSGPCVSRYYNASIRFTVRVAEEGMVVCCHGDEWHFPQPCTCLSDSLMLKLAQIRKSKHICELEVEKYNSRNLVLLDPENHIEIFLYTCAYSHLHRKELIVGLQRDVFSRFQTYPRVRMAADEGSPAWMIHGLDGSTDEVDVDELTSAVGEVKLTPQDAGWARQKDVVPTTDQAAREDEEANGGERHKWASEDPKYEHVGDPATAGAEHLELEKVLFNHKNRAVPGNFITVYDEFDVSTSTSGEKLNPLENVSAPPSRSLSSLFPFTNESKLDDARINAIVRENIKRCGYQDPLPIQKFAIPYLLDARDVIGVAQTGKISWVVRQWRPLTLARFRKDCSLSDPAYLASPKQGRQCSEAKAKSFNIRRKHRWHLC